MQTVETTTSSQNSTNAVLGAVRFENGDKVKYAYGLTFVFVGKDPFDEEYAYCIHPTAICQTQPELKYKRVDRLPIARLTHCT